MSSPKDTVAFIGMFIIPLNGVAPRGPNESKPGLGVMGYPMARNLRAGLGSDKTLLICDVNTDALERFMAEVSVLGRGPVRIVQNGFEAAKQAVRCHRSSLAAWVKRFTDKS